MPQMGDGAVFRGNRPNGHPSDSTEHLASRRSAAGAHSLSRYLLPLACVLLACVLTIVSFMVWGSVKQQEVLGDQPNGAHNSTLMALTIQELSQTQAQMMQMLKDISAAQSNVSSTVHAARQQQQQAAQQQQPPAGAVAPTTSTPDKNKPASKVPAAMAAIPVLTRLHNRLLRYSKDFEHHRLVMQQLLDKLVRMEAAAAHQEVQSQLLKPLGETDMLKEFVYELYKLMLASGKLIPCREDTTLTPGEPLQYAAPAAGASAGEASNSTQSSSSSSDDSSGTSSGEGDSSPSSTSSSTSDTTHSTSSTSSSSTANNHNSSSSSSNSSPRYYFATNLRDNSVQMPHFTLSLLQTLLRLPRNAAFVSVYESNSEDGAHGWIDVMQLAINVIGTHNRLVTRGMLVRSDGQHRIEFLAQVRNMALAPLYSHYADVRRRSGTNSSGSSSSSSGDSLPHGALPWSPDYVVFINDVYFCWSMVLRLMNYRADITCGMDWWQNHDATVALPAHLKTKGHQPKPTIPTEYRLEAPLANAMGTDQKNPIVFYDVWVSRDVSGGKFWWTHPFIMDSKSSPVVQKGLPVRASCCWNGLVVLRAAPFEAGVRFRMHQEGGECRASECSLVCDDFARLGYDNVVVDAGVQVAYDWHLAREMMAVGVEGVGQSTWAQVKASGVAQADRKPAYNNMECCSLQPGAKWVSFFSDCSRINIMSNNWTATAMKKSSQPWGG